MQQHWHARTDREIPNETTFALQRVASFRAAVLVCSWHPQAETMQIEPPKRRPPSGFRSPCAPVAPVPCRPVSLSACQLPVGEPIVDRISTCQSLSSPPSDKNCVGLRSSKTPSVRTAGPPTGPPLEFDAVLQKHSGDHLPACPSSNPPSSALPSFEKSTMTLDALLLAAAASCLLRPAAAPSGPSEALASITRLSHSGVACVGAAVVDAWVALATTIP